MSTPASTAPSRTGHERLARRGVMMVISSPSGAGKGTLSRLLLDSDKEIELSISVTTRGRRPSEVDGIHYHFIEKSHFRAMAENGELLEWAEVHGNFYGTPRASVERALAEGRDVLFDVDWQGAAQIRERMAEDVAAIFILPPTMAELRSRLHRRAEDPEDAIERRLFNARSEVQEWPRFDYVVINDDLDGAFADLKAILRAERLKRDRIAGSVSDFIERLLA
ncbi:guanylate kinase [Methylobrevis pamukkalensis]|uniref:Guanylate kinase n=1 Tax=Methylobrevis pamukkalensis TaxID=1439726 RepID=A0A1E3H0C1_9HYPH|nr:guanylate kinase [Methylobrevis pamukkalensis]ODN69595.1 Guanylate kinase [Methylobrevis pamukkalensis]